MKTYFKKDISQAYDWEKEEILKDLLEIPSNCLATIQWNIEDDSLYGVSYLDESVENSSNHGYIWKYEPAGELLADIEAQLRGDHK